MFAVAIVNRLNGTELLRLTYTELEAALSRRIRLHKVVNRFGVKKGNHAKWKGVPVLVTGLMRL